MRIKTIVIIIITVLFTIVLMQNIQGSQEIDFKFLWTSFQISKLALLLLIAAVAFILGVLIGRPKRVKRLGVDSKDTASGKGEPNTLSSEDKEYIN